MKNFLLIIAVSLCLTGSLFGQTVTTISAIQDTTGTGSADSPMLDSEVTVVGVVSGEIWAYGDDYFIQDGIGAWSGIMVHDGGRENAYGDSVRITATVTEYWGMTELTDVTGYEILGTGKKVEPTLLTTGDIGTDGPSAEMYEGVLVQVKSAAISNDDLGWGEWEIDDGSGALMIGAAADYYFKPADYDSVRSITGPLNYAFSNTKIEPRLAWDIVEGGKYTRIQRIQQVRMSDLLKVSDSVFTDVSYAADEEFPFYYDYVPGDTVTVKAIVTQPTGEAYAGNGIKFNFCELGGGPWSGFESYHPDSTQMPDLLEGDIIEMTGYVTEYQSGGHSNFTQMIIISEINILDFGQPIPDPVLVNTGDLRVPETAEQWEAVFVYVQDAVVTTNTPQYEYFGVDDGTGEILIDDVNAEPLEWYDVHALPPVGAIADSIRGYVYNNYGFYADSTAYKIEPLWMSEDGRQDIVMGGGAPPAIASVSRDVDIPTSEDVVTATIEVESDLTITGASLFYEVIYGGSSSGYTEVELTNTTGMTFEGEIPAQAEDSWVIGYVKVTDEKAQSTISPADTSIEKYCYVVTDGNLSIYDIQYNPYMQRANSPFSGVKVEVTGIVTTDTAAHNNYDGVYCIQEAEATWSGLFVDGIDAQLSRGDEIKVFGTVEEKNLGAWRWEYNTTVVADSFEVISSGNTIDPIEVTTEILANNSADAESYEGVVVKISMATMTSVNSHDVSFNDGTEACLVDDDFLDWDDFDVGDDSLYAFGTTIRPGNTIDMIQGVFNYSYSSYKIQVRDENDFGTITGINSDFETVPLSYQLKQNFPNPFNPETRIHFEIPQTHDVAIVIYNMLGQKVRTLVRETFKAGQHVVNWNGQNDYGLQVPTGIYIYRIKAGDFIAAKKMVMIK
jgi:hypothetical protein